MNVCTIGYVPPLKIGNPDAFLYNMSQFPTKHPLILFSDADWTGMTIRLPTGPEVARDEVNKFAINNLVWVTAMRIAIKQGFDYAIYIEADSRVGCAGWDDILFEEFFASPKANVCGGSMVIYNPCNGGKAAMERWADIVGRQVERKNFPIPSYGFKSAANATGSCIFVNGSLGTYSLAWMRRLFEFKDGESVILAQKMRPWDMEIGVRLWELFGVQTYDMVLHMDRVYSSFGDVITTEADRLAMLRAGSAVAVHQVKSAASV